ncbi:MAG: hypothetical protein ABIJ00_06225 [Candidatus Eisenbacteria bacterium]
MPAKVPEFIKFFRGGRLAIPLAAVGIIVFVVFGGHQKIMSFAVNQVTEFLLGAGDSAVREPAEYSSSHDKAPSKGDIFSGSTIMNTMAPTEAAAGEVDEVAQTAPESEPAVEALPDTAAALPDVADNIDLSRETATAYTAAFLRDPFYSLVATGMERGSRMLDVSGATMVGSVWGESGIIALLEDDGGRSYALRVGDRVINGSVVSVTPASITFSITIFDLTKSVTLELAEEGEW